uniref:Uncharacterized protein n=2 Tax=viral metagenome TaxID=1070528 RepID=A0A6M3JLV7_9ZZZZ
MGYVEMTVDNVEPSVKKHYEHLLNTMKIVQRYQCPYCSQLEDSEWGITHHFMGHAIDARIKRLWKQGRTLKEIDDLYHIFHSYYPDRPECDNSFLECHHNINKDNCFRISYLQCCDYPAYQICEISHDGSIKVWGIGGWAGGYGCEVSLGSLRNPMPKEVLYVHRKKYQI